MDQFHWLGVPIPEEEAAWAAYLQALRDNVFESWQKARRARLTLQSVRTSLGLPFMGVATGEGAPKDQGAWNAELEQDALKIQAIVALSMKSADECLQDKRKLIYNATQQSFGIELLPSDDIRIDDTSGVPQIVNVKTGQPVNITGNIEGDGTVGIPPLVIVAAGAASLVITGIAVYYTADRLCKTLETLSEDKTMRTLATKNAELVISGKATPAEAKALTDGIYKGAADLHAAKAKEEETAKSPWHKTIQTVAFVGLGIAGVYLAAQFVGRGRGSAPARAANPLANPKRYIGDAVIDIQYTGDADDSYKGSISAGGHKWKFEGLRPPRIGLGSGVAYDSPEAFDKMASSAASFGSYGSDGDPDEETARAISNAVGIAQHDNGEYEVLRRRPRG